jgi:ybbR family protein
MIRNKNVLRLLSVVLALFLWFYVVAVENPYSERKITKIPIQFVNHEELESRGLAIDYSDVQTMDVVISGSRSDVMKVSADEITATVDLTGYEKGKNYANITIKVPSKVELVDQRIQVIPITVEKLQTAKKKVNIQFTGTASKEKEAKLFTQDIEQVKVSGAQSQVAKVSKVFADLDVSKLTDNSKKYSLKIYAADAKGKEITGVELSHTKVGVQAGLYSIKSVPLSLDLKGEPAAEYRVSALDAPKTVKIAGFADELEKIDKLVSNPIYLSDLTESKKIPIEITLPEGVELAEQDAVVLDVKIKGLESKEFAILSSNVSIRGLATGKNATVENATLKVKAYVKDASASSISTDDIALYVDLTGLENGEHKVKVRAEQVDGIGDVSIEPQEVTVKID